VLMLLKYCCPVDDTPPVVPVVPVKLEGTPVVPGGSRLCQCSASA
jgi:hypothetical protein